MREATQHESAWRVHWLSTRDNLVFTLWPRWQTFKDTHHGSAWDSEFPKTMCSK